MISLIFKFLHLIADILPDSPFAAMLEDSTVIEDVLGYVNWFVPFRACLAMLSIWCGCMMAYFVYKHGKSILKIIFLRG